MKKMQCEVCGSTAIRKMDETTFEFQECGIQYDKSEAIKLLTEIEWHSATTTFPDTNNAPIPSDRTEDLDDCAVVSDTRKAQFINSDPRLSPSDALKIENLLLAGNKIGAIGVYRNATGVGLATAKDAVENMVRKM